MRTLRRLLADESGIALFMAAGVLGVLSITAASLIFFTNSNARSAHYAKKSTSALELAEAGVNRALAVLNNPTNWALRSDLLPATTETFEGGTVTWSGTLNQLPLNAPTWTLTATGSANNPSGGAPITRTVTATVPVTVTTSVSVENSSWNYVVSTSSDGVNVLTTMNTANCDMTIGQNSNTTSPIYVFGDLCMETPSSIVGGSADKLYVKGDVWLYGQNTNIGTSASALGAVAVAGRCMVWNKPLHQPCNNGDIQGNGAASTQNGDAIWVQGLAQSVTTATVNISTSVPVISPPTADFASWYTFASPGPNSPCVVFSGVPGNGTGSWATAFDDASKVRNNNNPLWNLTPATSYSCQTPAGELSWNATTKVLTVRGTIFIDGGAKIETGGTVTYTGVGAIYLSGSFLLRNTNLCAVTSGSNCNWTTSAWDTSQKMIVFATNGQGGNNPVPANKGMLIRQSQFQGALWSTYKIELDTSAQTEGPMIAPEVVIGNTVQAKIFPSAIIVPFGLPGQTIVHPTVGAPTIIPD